MKQIKGNYLADMILTVFLTLIFGVILIKGRNELIKVVLPCFLLFFLIIISLKQFYFLYDDKKLIVKNIMYPFLNFEYEVKNIDKIVFKSDSQLGGGIKIYFANHKKKFYYSNVPSYKIEEMIEDLTGNKTIEQ